MEKQERLIYSVGAVCKSLDIHESTLRLYEKQGLITSIKNPENQYRSYTFRDLCVILMVRQYRSYGLSLEKIQELIRQESAESLMQKFQQVIEEKEQLIKQEQKLLGLMKEQLTDLSYVTYRTNQFQVITMPEICFFNCQNKKIHQNPEYKKLVSQWSKLVPFSHYGCRMSQHDLKENAPVDFGYLCFRKHLPDEYLHPDFIETAPSRTYVQGVLRITKEQESIASFYGCIQPGLAYLKAHNFTLCGDAIAYKICTIKEEEQLDYYILLLPVAE